MNTKVLVTGSNGQLGQSLKALSKQYNQIEFVFTDSKVLDITNKEQVNQFFEKEVFHYCINCAAYTNVDQAEIEKEKAFTVNAEGVKNVALACKTHGVILIHISTDFVFDGEKKEPYTETDVPNPINVYGASKLQGEVEIRKILKEHFIIRTSWLYSEYGSNFMKTMLQLAKTRDEISVVSDQIGTPTYAVDLVHVIIKIIRCKNSTFGIYHFSSEGAVSWYGFAKSIFDKFKVKVKLNPVSTGDYVTLAKRPNYSVLDTVKSKEILKVNITNWEDSLENCLVNFRMISS
ncbi:dTDP-4-dehydrorhamnose reductase [Aestuariibaculum sediminum]|uniref:dTDP-4-dehydrorhamnose reductase n=1 Tax=Aestuariibaculum sediminum TaxID=2770637 RepID=A0A8J6Q1P7_9FLAO|nr:dTDP-4-dehydrorhamnose reductase [Aestuariibaculum sediminum]MBD0831220.1 dTDP-4-dehydrorhamnose reductase [Aestuariibaculum sediminum]